MTRPFSNSLQMDLEGANLDLLPCFFVGMDFLAVRFRWPGYLCRAISCCKVSLNVFTPFLGQSSHYFQQPAENETATKGSQHSNDSYN